MNRKLQIYTGGQWEYVFCRNAESNKIITTQDRAKALPAVALSYFEKRFGNDTFRVE